MGSCDGVENNTMYDYHLIPEHMRESLRRYVDHGIQPGSFMTSILANDFITAAQRADVKNLNALQVYCYTLINEVPRQCWGSYEIVEQWIKTGGRKGRGAVLEEEL